MNFKSDKTVIIVNYGMGNLHSLQNALEHLGVNSIVTSDAEKVSKAEILILPGVGSFRSAMNNLAEFGLDKAIHQAVDNGAPLLGICLGMQLLADEGEEDGVTKGLGLISGKVKYFSDNGLRLPHIGFNSVAHAGNRHDGLFDNIENGSDFYFVHSYHFDCSSTENVIGVTNYTQDFVSAVRNKNVYGVQFHPEKSQSNGLRLLSNFFKNHLG